MLLSSIQTKQKIHFVLSTVIKSQPNYRNVTKCTGRCLKGMSRNVTKCNKVNMPYGLQKRLQNVTECRCLIHEMLWNAEAETRECYEMIYKLI